MLYEIINPILLEFIIINVIKAFTGVYITSPIIYSTPSFLKISSIYEIHNSNLSMKQLPVRTYDNLCKFTIRNTCENSSPRDVMVAASLGRAENVIIFIRTLRTTGCKAQCVFLLDANAYNSLDKTVVDAVESFGGQIIIVGDLPKYRVMKSQLLCYYVLNEFLIQNYGKIDRVIICDLFDTYFQGDPFNCQVDYKYLNVIDETEILLNQIDNKKRLRAWNYTITDDDMYKKPRNGGYIGGSYDIVLRYTTLFKSEMVFSLVPFTDDQGLLNYLNMSQILKKNGIHIHPERTDELVRHTPYAPLNGGESIGNVRGVRSNDVFASVVHCYYSSKFLYRHLLAACPVGSYSKDFYLSKCDSRCLSFY